MIEVVDNPIIISWSEISAFRQCPFKHHLAYRERWTSDEDKEVLARGTAWHEILENHYAGNDEAVEMLLGTHPQAPLQTERQELLEWMYAGYIAMWQDEDEQYWRIKAIEWKGFSPLPNPWGGPSRFMLKVKIDLLAAKRGKLWVWDHKATRNLPSDKELDLDDQFGLYMWCMRQSGFPVLGALYNCARTQRNVKSVQALEERFSRTPLARTDEQLDMIAREAYMTASKMWPYDETDRLVNDQIPERNPDPDMCKWKCDFTEACLSSRGGGRIEDMLTAHGYSRRPFRDVELEYKEYQQVEAPKRKGK